MRSLRPHRTAAAYRATLARAAAAEKAALERLGLRTVDASGYGWGIINHDLFLSNDVVRNAIRRAAGRSADGGVMGRDRRASILRIVAQSYGSPTRL